MSFDSRCGRRAAVNRDVRWTIDGQHMNSPPSTKISTRPVANALFAIATLAPVSLGAMGSAFVPPWVGTAIGGGALLGGLVATWREGGLRALFIIVLVAAVAASAIAGWLLSRST